jgi:hypothetical protein
MMKVHLVSFNMHFSRRTIVDNKIRK